VSVQAPQPPSSPQARVPTRQPPEISSGMAPRELPTAACQQLGTLSAEHVESGALGATGDSPASGSRVPPAATAASGSKPWLSDETFRSAIAQLSAAKASSVATWFSRWRYSPQAPSYSNNFQLRSRAPDPQELPRLTRKNKEQRPSHGIEPAGVRKEEVQRTQNRRLSAPLLLSAPRGPIRRHSPDGYSSWTARSIK